MPARREADEPTPLRARPQAGAAAVATSALAVALLLLLTPLNERLSRPWRDAQARLLAPAAPPVGVLVVDIDDASLEALRPIFGTWPWKREVYAAVVDTLREGGARAIAINLVLADAQPGDEALARAIAQPGAPVLLAAAGMRHASDEDPAVAAVEWPAGPPPAAAYGWPSIVLPTRSVWPQPTRPPPVGVISTPLDSDGVLREIPLWHRAGAATSPPLPLLPLAVHRRLGGTAPEIGETALRPTFAAPARAPPALPFATLVSDAGAPAVRQQVQGSVVFIGSSALLADAVMTVQGQTSGTLALAQAYVALRDGLVVRPPSIGADALLALVALLPAAALLRRREAQPRRDTAASGLALVALLGVAGTLLLGWRQPTSIAAALAALAVGLGGAWLLHQRRQGATQRQLALQLAVAAEAARAKEEFLANVSHEIRTPLNALLGVAELLAASPLNAAQRRQVQLFQDAGQTLQELINDLLDLSKIESGRLELDIAAFSLHRLLDRVVELLRPRAEAKGLRLLLERDEGVPDGVAGDRLRLEQALVNLVGNAIKFTRTGEVCVRCLSDTARASGLCFEVIDTGIGIAASKLESIFEPFTQADNSVTRMYGGTGLGLAITRRVVGLMGGEVQVTSRPGLGSTFRIRLRLPAAPLAASAQASRAPARLAAAPASTGGAPLSLLLAEDNEVNVYIFLAMLEQQPVTVEVAPNGLTALDLLRRRRYDLAFVDIQMPGLDGLALTRELRSLEATSGRLRTPVVALTANAFPSDVSASLAAGCDRHLAKPYARDELLQMLAELALQAPAADATADAQARSETSAEAPLPSAAESPAAPSFDAAKALQGLGGDGALYQRVAEHARVFLQDWTAAYERAGAGGDLAQARRLAHDLKALAGTLAADELAAQAARLEALLRDGHAAQAQAQLQTLKTALAPVIVTLSRQSDRSGLT